MEIHTLKTWPEPFKAVIANQKTVEVRKADRDFKVGDVLELREFAPDTQTFTGSRCLRRITHVLPGGQFGIEDGYVVMSITDDIGGVRADADKFDKILHQVLRFTDVEDYAVGVTTGECDNGDRWVKITVAG